MGAHRSAELVLGTAQLGMAYGAANRSGQPDAREAELILRSAVSAGVRWLDTADIALFCQLKSRIMAFYGEDSWVALRERMMRDLPGAKDLPRNQVWDLSLFSENCARYP